MAREGLDDDGDPTKEKKRKWGSLSRALFQASSRSSSSIPSSSSGGMRKNVKIVLMLEREARESVKGAQLTGEKGERRKEKRRRHRSKTKTPLCLPSSRKTRFPPPSKSDAPCPCGPSSPLLTTTGALCRSCVLAESAKAGERGRARERKVEVERGRICGGRVLFFSSRRCPLLDLDLSLSSFSSALAGRRACSPNYYTATS